ncbi:S49 family peptidase [Shimia sp.]|uniref:S49 family peptidase n=1 Tax=Shimia sp. TaxID=1954381 RepID=UPI003B8E8DF9
MKTGDMLNITQRAFNTPLLLDPRKATVIAQHLGPRFLGMAEGIELDVDGSADNDLGARLSAKRPMAASMIGDELARSVKKRGGGYTNIMGVAVISVTGTLARRGSYVGESSGVTSYEGLSAQFRAAGEDDEVRAVAMEIDSFGGEAAGMFKLAEDIRELRKKKPVYAFLAEYALSAGYGIASQADHITIPPFGEAGSIGVVGMHLDYEKHLQQQGIKVTLIHSGAHKVEGNPYQALPEAVRDEWQESTDAMWLAFADSVAEGRRGKLSIKQALETEARCYRGQAAVDAGLVDEVAEARDAFGALLERLNPPVSGGGTVAAASPKLIGEAGNEAIVPHSAAGVLAKPLSGLIPKADLGRPISSLDCSTGAGAPSTKESDMSKDVKKPDATAPDNQAQAPDTGATTQRGGTDALQAERDRAAKITAKVASAGLKPELASTLISEGVSLEVAYERILDAKADAAQDGGEIVNHAPSASVNRDARDKSREGMTKALLLKVGMDGGERNEFTGMSLREMARYSLMSQGVAIPAGGVMALASAAFAPAAASGGMHSTSDFALILADVANKSMLKGFDEAPETFERFTSVGTLTDFKPTSRVGLDSFPSLDKVGDGAEFKYGTMGEHGETAVLATYGKLFAITRQTIINDDLDAFSKVPARMGRAARRTIGDLVFAILTGNPAMGDEKALFHADHRNLASSGALPSEATINAAINAMSLQKSRDGKTRTPVVPAFLIAPPTQRSAVLQSLNSEYAPDDTDKQGSAKQPRAANTVRDAAEPIFDPRLAGENNDGTNWFMAGDPNMYDTIEVSYLDGVQTPYLDQQDGWSVDGTEFKVRIDAAATALAEQGVYKNAGS